MKLTIEDNSDDIKKVLQAISGSEEHDDLQKIKVEIAAIKASEITTSTIINAIQSENIKRQRMTGTR